MPNDFYTVLTGQAFEMLSISSDHAYAVGDLPIHHKDPFDRMLIAQAKVENPCMVTHDAFFDNYDISVLEV